MIYFWYQTHISMPDDMINNDTSNHDFLNIIQFVRHKFVL